MKHSQMTIYNFKNESEFKLWTMNSLRHEFLFDYELHEDKRKAGIADVSYGANGINGWIEFKFEKHAHFETAQPGWLKRRSETGGHVYVIVGFSNRSCFLVDCKLCEKYYFPIIDQSLGTIAKLLTRPYPWHHDQLLSRHLVPPQLLSRDHPGLPSFLSVLDRISP